VNLPGAPKVYCNGLLLLCKNKPSERLAWHKKGKTIQGNSFHDVNNVLAFQLRQPKPHSLDQKPQSVLCFFTLLKTDTTGTLFPSGGFNNFLQKRQVRSRSPCISPYRKTRVR